MDLVSTKLSHPTCDPVLGITTILQFLPLWSPVTFQPWDPLIFLEFPPCLTALSCIEHFLVPQLIWSCTGLNFSLFLRWHFVSIATQRWHLALSLFHICTCNTHRHIPVSSCLLITRNPVKCWSQPLGCTAHFSVFPFFFSKFSLPGHPILLMAHPLCPPPGEKKKNPHHLDSFCSHFTSLQNPLTAPYFMPSSLWCC